MLGPLQAWRDGRILDLGGPRPRALLAILVLRRGEVVAADRLVDELWGESPPRTAAHLLHVYVSSLRKELGSDLVTIAPGYRLDVDPEDVDAYRFQRLVAEGTAELAKGKPAQAAAVLREALGLWRGPALADFAYEQFAAAEISRLEELRLTAVETRIEADLARGEDGTLVGELRTLVAEHPYRERLRAQLMLALYRSGRQAEALAAYGEARRALVDDLGLEPTAELQQLQRRMLEHDPQLRAERPTDASDRRPRLRRRLLVALGVVVAVAGAVVGFVAFDGDTRASTNQDAVAVVDAARATVESFVPAGATPQTIVFGEGSAWVLNADDQTVSRLDPETTRVEKTFATGATPTALAVGGGALWIGVGSGRGNRFGNSTASVSRVDPESAAVTRRLVLPRPRKADLAHSAYGVDQIAVGAGAVWAINPDLTVSRIDPATGRLLAVVRDTAITPSSSIAAGKEGVWLIGEGASVTSIDPRTNRLGQTIRFTATPFLTDVAVGAGSVWATVPEDGVVWRIEPGRRPLTRTVQVGFGVSNITFAEGIVWATNLIDGTVSRIDPRTNVVTHRIDVGGTPHSVAVGAGKAFVTVAGVTARGALPDQACGPIESGGREPDVLIASDLPLQGFAAPAARAMADAVRLVLRTRDFRAGRFAVGYASCDHSTARIGGFDFYKCAANGRSLARSSRLVAIIGPYDSDCAQVEIFAANDASNGELAVVSPATTYSGLTRAGPGAWAHRTDPGRYYPSGRRTFMRVSPAQDLQLAGTAQLIEQLGFERVFFVYGDGPWGVSAGRSFLASARKLGLTVVARRPWDPSAATHVELAEAVTRSGADVVVLDGIGFFGGNAVVRDLRSRLGDDVALVGGEGFSPIPELLGVAGRRAHGMYVVSPSLPYEALGREGRRFLRAFDTAQHDAVRAEALQAAQSAEAVLAAIARSDGTRASVLEQLRKGRIADGLMGPIGFDRRGDVLPARLAVYRVTGGKEAGAVAYAEFEGARLARVVTVAARMR